MSTIRYWIVDTPRRHRAWQRALAERTELSELTAYRCVSLRALRGLDVSFVLVLGAAADVLEPALLPWCMAYLRHEDVAMVQLAASWCAESADGDLSMAALRARHLELEE